MKNYDKQDKSREKDRQPLLTKISEIYVIEQWIETEILASWNSFSFLNKQNLEKILNLISKATPLFFSVNFMIGTRAFAIT